MKTFIHISDICVSPSIYSVPLILYFVLQTELSLLNCKIITCYSCKDLAVHPLKILPLEMRKLRFRTVTLLAQSHKAGCTKIGPETRSPDLPRFPFYIISSISLINEKAGIQLLAFLLL